MVSGGSTALPISRHRRMDDTFFAAGNKFYVEEHATVVGLDMSLEQQQAALMDMQALSEMPADITCRSTCSRCHKWLPSEHLLSLHITEAHDSFFQAQAARKLPVFACLVPGCGKLLSSAPARARHLRDVHHYAMGLGLESMHLPAKMPRPRRHATPRAGACDGARMAHGDSTADASAASSASMHSSDEGEGSSSDGTASGGGQIAPHYTQSAGAVAAANGGGGQAAPGGIAGGQQAAALADEGAVAGGGSGQSLDVEMLAEGVASMQAAPAQARTPAVISFGRRGRGRGRGRATLMW